MSLYIHDMRCPESFMSLQVRLKFGAYYFIWFFHPHTHTHTPPNLFLRRMQLCQDYCTCSGGEQRDFWQQKLQHWDCPLKKRGQFLKHTAMYRMWVISANEVLIFQVSVWFSCRKIQFWQGIFSYFKCEILEEIWLIANNYRISMWYLFFSEVMWSHRHCGEWRGCFRCKNFHAHQPVVVPLFQIKKSIRIFVDCLFS